MINLIVFAFILIVGFIGNLVGVWLETVWSLIYTMQLLSFIPFMTLYFPTNALYLINKLSFFNPSFA